MADFFPPEKVQAAAAAWIPPEILVFLLCLAVLAAFLLLRARWAAVQATQVDHGKDLAEIKTSLAGIGPTIEIGLSKVVPREEHKTSMGEIWKEHNNLRDRVSKLEGKDS